MNSTLGVPVSLIATKLKIPLGWGSDRTKVLETTEITM
jgi:hypothetical protein